MPPIPKPKALASSDLTVVIQGPIKGQGKAAIQAVRNTLPQAEIIISTWVGEPEDEAEGADIKLFSTPPEPIIDFDGRAFNLALQMESTRKGIERATRPYVLKLRADLRLYGTQLLIAFPAETTPDKILKGRIVVTSNFTRDATQAPVLFHLSDLIQLGLREDMLDFWSSPLPTENEMRQKGPFVLLRNMWGYCGAILLREAAEQNLVTRWLTRHGIPVSLDHPCQTRADLFTLWEKVLAANFYVKDADSSGILFSDRFQSRSIDKSILLSEAAFQELARNPGSTQRYRICLFNKWIKGWLRPRYWLVRAYLIALTLLPAPAHAIRLWIRKREAKS